MKTIKIYDGEEVLDELEVRGSFGIVHNSDMGVECYDEFMEYMPYSEQFVYRREYQRIAIELVGKYSGRLVHVEPKRIAFIVDEHWELSEKNTPKSQEKIKITRAAKLSAFGDKFDYIIHMRQYWLDRWSCAQIHAAIMSQLLLINPKGGLDSIPADAANPLVATFGVDYLKPNTVIGNLLTEDIRIVEFRRADGQITMDELPVQPAGSQAVGTASGDGHYLCGKCVNWHEESDGMGSCNAEIETGAIADSHPACGEFYPQYPLSEIPSDVEEQAADLEGGDDHGDVA